MSNFVTMYIFHIKQYFRNSYFFWLVVTSTIGILMLQYLVSYANQQVLTSKQIIISGIFGMWSSAVTSAGILHFQRAQGVLVYLINSPSSTLKNLIALVSSSSTFGLLAYPLAYVVGGILNGFIFPSISFSVLVNIFLFWISSLSITYVVSEIFLLTKNAFVYEDLFVTPIMIISGLFSLNGTALNNFEKFSLLIPITYPVQLLTNQSNLEFKRLLIWLIILTFWLFLAFLFFRILLKKIRIKGEVEAM